MPKWLTATLLTLLLTNCSPIDIANTLTPSFGYEVERDIAYGDNPRHKVDIYRPFELRPESPVILFFYGGRWQFGDKDDYLFLGQALASRGFLTMVADYRLYPEVRWDGILNDAAMALSLAAKIAGERSIVLSGHSAGAYLAAMTALKNSIYENLGIERCQIAGFVGLAGPYDFLPLVEPDIIQVFGPGEAGLETQPINFVSADDPPVLLIHGLDDETVFPKNSINLAKQLDHAELKLYEGVGHIGLMASFTSLTRFLSPALNDMTAFLNKIDGNQCI